MHTCLPVLHAKRHLSSPLFAFTNTRPVLGRTCCSSRNCRVDFLSGAESVRDKNWTIYCTRFIRYAHKVSGLTEHLRQASCLVPTMLFTKAKRQIIAREVCFSWPASGNVGFTVSGPFHCIVRS